VGNRTYKSKTHYAIENLNKKEIELYTSIDTLLLYNWDRYLATKDNNWFIIGYDGRQAKVQSDVLTQLEASIQDEYFKEINDNDFTKSYRNGRKSII
jgi:hypothetical protein